MVMQADGIFLEVPLQWIMEKTDFACCQNFFYKFYTKHLFCYVTLFYGGLVQNARYKRLNLKNIDQMT
ncbi:MAG: hypothetical protein J5792_00875, partial [Bacteroidales bacterium]|nr:hypothetical protein [Bacteroidales bacterium]